MVLRNLSQCGLNCNSGTSKNVCADQICGNKVTAADINVGPGNLEVTGDVTVNQYGIEGSNDLHGGHINAAADIFMGGKLTGSGTSGFPPNLTSESMNVIKSDDGDSGGDLAVEGEITASGKITANSDVSVTGDMDVSGALAVTNTLVLGGKQDSLVAPFTPQLTGFIFDNSYSEDAATMANFITTQGAPASSNVFGDGSVKIVSVGANFFEFTAQPTTGNIIGTNQVNFEFTFNVAALPQGRVPKVTNIGICNDFNGPVSQSDTGVPVGMFHFAAGKYQMVRAADFATSGKCTFSYQLIRNMSWNSDTLLAFHTAWVWVEAASVAATNTGAETG